MAKIDNQLKSLTFIPDDNWQHVLITDQMRCHDCHDKLCLTICPSGVFAWNLQPKDPILVMYKQCVECGSCRLVCDNIDFSYPLGGYGVQYKEG
ncbi:ferredoxin family protein [Dendrosporobacter sp. 1207_IL3150]|uniref:ferredoxin family protein n=1 Tax=Dendrosporobacter sp. 1207_IL3150 TaxID=3084054 RepID=UPI002FDB57B4